ncbi:MAG: helix-turn-helix transcriptional regulator [Flavobacteriaceae bacterium]
MATIYSRISTIIENENISVAAFERKIGVGRNSISSAIRNKSSISHTVLHNICQHYPQYSIDWIVFGKDSPHTRGIELLMKMKKLIKIWNIEDLNS